MFKTCIMKIHGLYFSSVVFAGVLMTEEYKIKTLKEVEKARKSIKISFLEGMFYSLNFGLGDSFLSAYAIFMKATNFQIGVLSSLPNLLGAAFQIGVPELIEKIKNRKKIFVTFAFLQTFIWIPIIMVQFFTFHRLWFLIFFACLYAIFFGITLPAWGSTVADLVRERIRGKIFSYRNSLTIVTALIATFTAGFILDLFKFKVFIGFIIIFGLALVFRMISSFLLTGMYEPPLIVKEESSFSFWEFVKKMPSNNFGRFVIYMCLLNAAAFTAVPYFSVFMLRDLKMSYFNYGIAITCAALSSFVFVKFWGKHADRYGNIRILKITGFLVPVASLIWYFSSSFYWILLCQINAGFCWSGFNLASSNFIYDSTSPHRRARCISYYNILVGAGIFIGAMIGSLILKNITFIRFGSNLPILFLITSFLRLLVSLSVLPFIKEIRKVSVKGPFEVLLNIFRIYPVKRKQ